MKRSCMHQVRHVLLIQMLYLQLLLRTILALLKAEETLDHLEPESVTCTAE